MSESTKGHRVAAEKTVGAVACAVITVSDTRTPETDKGGDLIVRLLTEGGHDIVDRCIVPDDPGAIDAALDRYLGEARVLTVLLTGGTGIAKRDTTIEVVRRRFVAELSGFGEIFRMLSWEQVGAAAMLSRATAGLAEHAEGGDTFVFAMPGSVNAVETAMVNLIVPELGHLVWERKR